jgi:hypothetical protein
LIAAMLRRGRLAPGAIKFFSCSQLGRATRVRAFEPRLPLFEDQEILDSLTSPEDAEVVEALLLRGWLDG